VVGKTMKVFWNSDYTNISYDFDTSRKSNNIVSLIKENQELPSQLRLNKDIPNVDICDPYIKTDVEITETLINSWLTKNYVEALKTNNSRLLSESQGFKWCPNTYAFARAHSHGLIASIDEVLSVGGRCGSLSSGLHHASMGSGAGFCTINGIALSAIYAHEQGLEPVILDFDAHCGGGTMNFLNKFNNSLGHSKKPIQHIDVSTNHFDAYESTAKWSYLDVRGINDDYLGCIEKALKIALPLVTDKTVFIYNAGIDPMDAYEIDHEVIKQREKLVSDFIGDNKAIFALAGGYSGQKTTRDDVAKTHLYNIYGWAWSQK